MKSWKDVLRSVAPALATALGGPLAGVAVTELGAKVLGKPDASEAEVAAAVTGGGADLIVKLKELDQDFSTKMAAAGIEFEKIEAQDRADARARQVSMKDWVPAVIACLMTAAFIVLLFAIATRPIPEANRDAVHLFIGTLGTAEMGILGYYFGSSRGSQAKDATIAKVLENGKES